MRTAAIVALCSSICLTLFALRYHIYIIGEVIYAYSAFPYQDLNYYDYAGTNGADLTPPVGSPEQVPRLLHQIVLTREDEPNQSVRDAAATTALAKYADAMESCREIHGNWTFHLWDDENGKEFVREHYLHVFDDYMSYKQTIQRTNILRYLVLHHYGGVYLDMDVKCRAPLDDLLHLDWLTPGAHPSGINNAFILTKPGHPFLEFLISRIHSHNVFFPMPYISNMISTGCLYISLSYTQFPKSLPGSSLYILGSPLDRGTSHFLRGHSITPLFEHLGASSWHSWDAALIVGIGAHRRMALLVVTLGAVLLAVVVRGVLRRRIVARRRSGAWEKESGAGVKERV